MEKTVAKLEHLLKDPDVKEQPYLVHQIKELMGSLRRVLYSKQTRWKADEAGACPCGKC